LVGRDLGDIQ